MGATRIGGAGGPAKPGGWPADRLGGMRLSPTDQMDDIRIRSGDLHSKLMGAIRTNMRLRLQIAGPGRISKREKERERERERKRANAAGPQEESAGP